MAIGDNLNDLEMLEFAGCPVVMGNALDELKIEGLAGHGQQRRGGRGARDRDVRVQGGVLR